MSDRLTDAELDALEELHAAATPGAWRPEGADVSADAGDVCYDADDTDAYYIASAHNALPALLAEVREHRAMRARLLSEHFPVEVEPSDTICGGCSTLRGKGDSLRYFPSVEWPCPVAALVDGDDR